MAAEEEELKEAKSKEEIGVAKELNNIGKLTEGILAAGEGMNEMVKSLEKMAENLEERSAPEDSEGAWHLARTPNIKI